MTEKWSINRLSDETGYDRRSIKKWLENAGKAPCDVDGKVDYYTLRDFIDAVVQNEMPKCDGDAAAELERKTRLQADLLEIELAQKRNEVLSADEIFLVLSNRDLAIRRVIETADMPDAAKDKVFNDLKSIRIEDILAERKAAEGVPSEGE